MPFDMKLALEQEAQSGRPGSPYRLCPRELSKASAQSDPSAPNVSRYSVPPGNLHTPLPSLHPIPAACPPFFSSPISPITSGPFPPFCELLLASHWAFLLPHAVGCFWLPPDPHFIGSLSDGSFRLEFHLSFIQLFAPLYARLSLRYNDVDV